MPKALVYIVLILTVLAMIPPALIARARTSKSQLPRIHYIQDMDAQAKFKAQRPNPLFADARAMRMPIDGTVARDELLEDEHYALGVAAGDWAADLPRETPLTMDLLERGRARFEIYCALCHGYAGYGDGIVHRRAIELQNNPDLSKGTIWVQPKNLHDPTVRDQPIGQIFNTISNGVRTMSGYAAQIPLADRWAIAAYVDALQRSQNARPEDVPAAERGSLPLVNLVPEEEE